MTSPVAAAPPTLLKVILAYLAVYVIWGSTYLGIIFCLDTIHTVFLMPGVRFLVAGVILYAWARRRAGRPSLTQWRDAAIIGGALLFIANGTVVWAETRVPSGLTALLIAVVPLCMVILEWLRPGGVRPGRRVVAGIILGLAGLAILTGPESLAGGGRVDLLGAGGLLVACFVWSAGSLYSRYATKPSSPYLAAGMQMISGGVLHLVTGTIFGEWSKVDVSGISLKSAASLVYLIFFGSIVAFTAYMWLMQVSTPARVATYAYVNPLVAVFLGWAFNNESINQRTFAATAVIVTAVAFIVSAQASPPSSTIANRTAEEPTDVSASAIPDRSAAPLADACATNTECA
ncbi:MAG: EamA family transporter [Planctomycetota bacterium]|nr:MAG: EamA family transporter [Planctomycetota bacterium]